MNISHTGCSVCIAKTNRTEHVDPKVLGQRWKKKRVPWDCDQKELQDCSILLLRRSWVSSESLWKRKEKDERHQGILEAPSKRAVATTPKC